MKNELGKLCKFGVVSGFGWIIDFGIYSYFTVFLGLSIIYSNLISATIAVIFVFFISVYRIFLKNRRFVFGGLIVYMIYQAFSIYLFSFLIDKTSQFLIVHYYQSDIIPVISKIGITPLTLSTNYLFMRLLTSKFLSEKSKCSSDL